MTWLVNCVCDVCAEMECFGEQETKKTEWTANILDQFAKGPQGQVIACTWCTCLCTHSLWQQCSVHAFTSFLPCSQLVPAFRPSFTLIVHYYTLVLMWLKMATVIYNLSHTCIHTSCIHIIHTCTYMYMYATLLRQLLALDMEGLPKDANAVEEIHREYVSNCAGV